MIEHDPYLAQVYSSLPRLLAFFDVDTTSKTVGIGDRYFWAWGLTDFGNATFQGAAHGLARLWVNGYWPYKGTTQKGFIDRIDRIFMGAKSLTRKDGSLEEAFPYEGSYCVTALVAYDLLCAYDLLEKIVERRTSDQWLEIVEPMIRFLTVADETHAIISNHLATAVAALNRWNIIKGEATVQKKMEILLERILSKQSSEGWFEEYGGADPGYQTLCLHYLADAHLKNPNLGILEPLKQSILFLTYFVHPDGSFAGLYGARCTRFYFPSGIMALEREIKEARALVDIMRESIADYNTVTLSTMDDSNFIPMFNAYCWAAALSKDMDKQESEQKVLLPFQSLKGTKIFSDAGLVIDSGPEHYTIISIFKGGVVVHFKNGILSINNGGALVKNRRGRYGSSQSFSRENKWELNSKELSIVANISPMPKSSPTPIQFIILRLMCVTVFRFSQLRELAKQILVKLLITRRKKWPVGYKRIIHLGYDLSVEDFISTPVGFERITPSSYFVSIHMASQGYWQMQDEF